MNNHSAINEKSLNPHTYEGEVSNTEEEERQYFNRKVVCRYPHENKAESPEQKKVSMDTLDQRSSISLDASFDNGIERLSIISVEQKSKSTGEFYLANDSLSKQRIIDQLSSENVHWCCIRSQEDLEKHGLIQQVWLEDGKLHQAEGRLFLEESLTLIFDLTVMTPSDIASFNDILQVEPRCNDKPLGDYVKRVFLANNAMLEGKQITNPDLWRRLGRMIKKEAPIAGGMTDSITDEALLNQKIVENISASKSQKIIDFSVSDEWYFLLFGGITQSDQRTLIFSEGALAQLGNDTHLVLKNAPWNSAGFKEAIAATLRAGGFEVNRQRVKLPDRITFSRENVSTTELDNLKSQVLQKSEMFQSEEMFVCINSSSLDNLQGSMRIEDISVVRADMLATLLNGSNQLVITSDLEEKQWLWLLAKLDKLSEDERPLLFSNLPPMLLLSPETMQRHEDGELTLLHQGNHSFAYEINPDDTLESLQQVSLNSQNNLTFFLTNSALMKNFVNGTPVILGGLACNPALAASLEALLLPHPYLFIHGNKVDLPDAKVTLVRSAEKQITSSPLINHLLSTPIDSQRESTPENLIYSLLKSLPHSYQKNYPNTPYWSLDMFQCQFVRQAEAEQRLDNSSELLLCHQRCALHVCIAKSYRGNASVYGYIKAKIAQYYPDEVTDNRSDRSALQQWMAKHPDAKREDVQDDFWTLARHCPVDVYESINNIESIDETSLTKLATHFVGAAGEFPLQATLAYQLGIDLTLARKQLFFDGVMRSTLRDALIANRASLKPDTVISKTVALLEKKISSVLVMNSTDQDKLQSIKEVLVLHFREGQLPDSYQNLPNALITNQRHSYAREQRRLARLADLIQRHPIVFLQGESGAGKTFMAKAVAPKAGYSDCKVIQIDPNQTSDELFGGQQLKRYTVADNKTDYCSEFHQGPLLEWALSDDPDLLLLDEANLASEGLLSPLVGLTRKQIEIHCQGNQYPLTKKHRIIMTGNPDYYEGRHLNKTLQSRVLTLFYPPLRDSVLADSIILPSLIQWPSVQKQQACDRIITLLNLFKELVPGDLITARDIKDVLATVHQILSYYPDSLNTLTKEQVNALVRRAFMDSLAGAVTKENQERLNLLDEWYQKQYSEDISVMTNMDQAFEDFVQQMQTENTDADFLTTPIRQLVYHYWQNLEKGEGGRTALLVEGETGWGKDFVLGKTIKLWQHKKQQQALEPLPDKPFVHINANPNQLPVMEDMVTQAKKKGLKIGISEVNLMPSQNMERLFNDVLTSQAKQGFRLFATINSSSFEGRETFSPALKSRCTLVRLDALSQLEMLGLVQRLLDMPDALPQWLVGHFHQLSTALADQKSPVRLALDDLLSIAKDLVYKNPDQWKDAFRQQLPLQFLALTKHLPTLEEESVRLAREQIKAQHRLNCEKAINSLSGLPASATIKFGNLSRFGDREVTVKPNEVVTQVISDLECVLKNSKVNDKTVKEKSAATCVEKRSEGELCVFDAIENIPHFKIIRYFPAKPYDFEYYRLSLSEIRIDENGRLRIYSIDWQEDSLTAVVGWPNSTSWRTDLRSDELPGHIELTLSDQWQSLPSLTPTDQLRAIRCRPKIDIQLARCQATGLLLIKRQESRSMKVTIDFIIALEQTYFIQIKPKNPLIIQENLCSQRFKKLLDEHIFNACDDCDAYQALRTIHQIYNIPRRLSALMSWLNTFNSDKNITDVGECENIFLNLLREKRGVCSHKSIIFENLCRYWGIPARQVFSVCHAFVEVSPDGGNTWRQYDIGSGGQLINHMEAEQNWDNSYHRLDITELRPPVDRVLLASRESNQRDASLCSNQLVKNERFLENENIRTLAKQKLLRVVKETFINNQSLSHPMLIKLKTCFEQTLREIEEDKRKFITQLLCDIFYFFKEESDGFDCICCISEIDDDVKNVALGFIQNTMKYYNGSEDLECRIQRMLKTLPPFINYMEIKNAPAYTDYLSCFIQSLPKSKYLEGKISHVKINRTYTRTPKANSQFSFEKRIAGLPSFFNYSTCKESKPVIIDLHDVGMALHQRSDDYVRSQIDKKNTLLDLIDELGECDFKMYKTNMLYSFFVWIASNKPKDGNVWRWLVSGYHLCYEQMLPIEVPAVYFQDAGVYPTEWTSEMIKDQMKSPTAVILKEDDMLTMFNEFVNAIPESV